MKRTKTISIVLTVFFVLAALTGCSKKAQAGGTQKRTIRVQTADTFKPDGFANEKGEADGFDIEIVKEVAKLIPEYNFTYEAVPYDVLYSNLESGKSDLATLEVGYTKERAEKFTLTNEPFNTLVTRFITLEQNAGQYKTWEDFLGKTVYVVPGADAAKLEEYNKGHSDNPIKIEYISDPATCVKGLVDGKVAAFVRGEVAVKDYGDAYGVKLKAVAKPVRQDKTFFLLKKNEDPDLIAKIDAAVKQLNEKGILSSVGKKWHNGLDYTPPYVFKED